MKIVLNST